MLRVKKRDAKDDRNTVSTRMGDAFFRMFLDPELEATVNIAKVRHS